MKIKSKKTNPIWKSEVIDVIGQMCDGLLIVKGTNSLHLQAIESRRTDWMIFWYDDPNLKRILELKGKDIQTYKKECISEIKKSKQLPTDLKNIYTILYSSYFEDALKIIKKLSKNYAYIRVFYSRMGFYIDP